MTAVTVSINGERREAPAGITLLGLLAELDLDPGAVVVEVNRQIVRRPRLKEQAIAEGDRIELVHFVGGG